MRRPCTVFLLVLLLFLARLVPAQEIMGLDVDGLLDAGQEWADENLDLDAALGEVDTERIQAFWQQLQSRLAGENELDLAALREPARQALKLLELHEAAGPYAAWLRTRFDYFDVASELDRAAPPPPPPTQAQPAPPRPKPAPVVERKAWRKALQERPAPAGAEAYAVRLKPVFRKQGVPEELVWLAEVESSFNPDARSPVGAAGLFQFMPATARSLGLALRPRDERRHPEKSADAAARYLKYLYGRFRSWPLALAAYNAGEGNVRKALDRRRARTFDEIAESLPAETRMYVPKIDATLLRREGKGLDALAGV